MLSEIVRFLVKVEIRKFDVYRPHSFFTDVVTVTKISVPEKRMNNKINYGRS